MPVPGNESKSQRGTRGLSRNGLRLRRFANHQTVESTGRPMAPRIFQQRVFDFTRTHGRETGIEIAAVRDP